jgi:hypothetical protein
MSHITDKAKDIFEKLKPLIMDEVSKDTGPQEKPGEQKAENNESAAAQVTENRDSRETIVPKAGGVDILMAVINGAGVGLLLGVLLGLSISPVVSGVIGTLSGLLAVLLGTSERYMSQMKSVRIGAFGFFCVAGIMLGIHIRTNNAMMPDREKMLHDYTKVGFSKQEALDFIAFREFGLVPAGWKGAPSPQESEKPSETGKISDTPANAGEPGAPGVKETSPATKSGNEHSKSKPADPPPAKIKDEEPVAKNKVEPSSARVFANANATGAERQSVLYSSDVNASDCDIINNADSSQDIAEIRNTFDMAGGTWQELAQNLGSAGFPEKVYIRLLFTVRSWFCESGRRGVIKIQYNEKLKRMTGDQTLDQIKNTITPADTMWNTIKEQINKNVAVEYQKPLYLTLIKTFCHEKN